MDDLFTNDALTVSELNMAADAVLQDRFADYWVAGEVSNLTRAASGHLYFALKDEAAQVRCALFKFAAARLGAPLKEGDHIEVRGKIGIYGARGEFQITVNEVRQIGLGRLFERYERLKNRLQAEGVFDSERKCKLPAYPRAIGIVTSLAAAALRDVVSTLKRRAPHIPVLVYPTPVQGAGSEQQIAHAIHTANQRTEVDVLIVCRGGGSIEDLWAFNEEVTVRAMAACTIPIVSGVGHETDFTLADFVADVRAPTPTAAAELVSPNRVEQLQQLTRLQGSLHHLAWQHYRNAAQKTDFLTQQLRHPRQRLAEQRAQIQHHAQQLRAGSLHCVQSQQRRVEQLVYRVQHNAPAIAQQQQRMSHLYAIMQRNMRQFVQQKCQQIHEYESLLQATSPHAVLQRGYAIVRDARGNVVRDSQRVRTGQVLQVAVAHGTIDVQVATQQRQPSLFDE